MAKLQADFSNLVFVTHDRGTVSHPEPGLTRRVLALNDKLFIAEHEMDQGWKGAMHSHPHEQAVYVVRGHIQLLCEGKTFELRAGDTFVVRGGVEHGASAIEKAIVVDVFTPCREDYL